MTKITHDDAWRDFWAWLRSPAQENRWREISRSAKNYLYQADYAAKEGRLGYERTRSILERYAPERYRFEQWVVVISGK